MLRATKPRPLLPLLPRVRLSTTSTTSGFAPEKECCIGYFSTDASATTNEVVSTTPAHVDTEVESDTGDSSLQLAFTEFIKYLQQMSAQFSAIGLEFKTLEKRLNRELRAAQKGAAKRRRKAVNRQPSGFVKPTLISSELATFLGLPRWNWRWLALCELREINKYIRANSLQDKDNGRRILPDCPLRTSS